VPIIPGFSGPFGREDLEGHVLIPGASRACYETRKTLKRWKKRAAQEAEGWYGDLQQNNLEVIKVSCTSSSLCPRTQAHHRLDFKISHLLDGLDGRLWKAQRDLNKRHVRALESRRRRMRQREAALAPLTAEHEVAAGLVSLARSSAKRGTSTGAARKLGRAAAPA